jgi:hypothetical protein
MALQLEGRISASDELLDVDLRDMQIVSGASGVFLYAGTGQNGGISVYRLDQAGGLASLTDATYFTTSGVGIGSFEVLTVDGHTRLVLNGAGNGRLVRYGIKADGGLTGTSQITLPGTGQETSGAVTALELSNGTSALYMVDDDNGALIAWTSNGAGGLCADRRGGAEHH